MRQATLLARVLPIVLFIGACGSDAPPNSSSRGASPTPSSEEPDAEQSPRCNEDIPFEATYVPEGFASEPEEGQASETSEPDMRGQVIEHYSSPQSRAIEIRRPGSAFIELARSDDSRMIEVLGEKTPNFGPMGPGDDRLLVQFVYSEPGAPRESECSSYSANGFNISLRELIRFAEGLRPE